LLKDIRSLHSQASSNTQDEQLIKTMQTLTVDARYIQEAMMSALKRFSEHATPIKLLEGLRTEHNLAPLQVRNSIFPSLDKFACFIIPFKYPTPNETF